MRCRPPDVTWLAQLPEPLGNTMSMKPNKRPIPSLLLVSGLLLVLAMTSACSGGIDRQQKSSVSALWIAEDSAELPTSTMARLKDMGVSEAFVPAGRLFGETIERFDIQNIGSGLPATLSIDGSFKATATDEAAAMAESVAEQLRQLRFDIESQGLLVVGLHLDLREVADLEAYGAFLAKLNRDLDDEVFLSATVVRQWVGREELRSVTDAVDFVVAFFYGQRIDETEAVDAWDFTKLESRLQALEELGVPYQVGAVILGYVSHLDPGGKLKSRTTRRSLLEVIGNRNMSLRPGFTLEGANRRVYALVADRDTKIGDWQVAAGEGIRVVRAASSDIEEMLRLLDLWQLPNYLGQVFFKLPAENEPLSMHSDSLLSALDTVPASPDLAFDVTVQRRTGRGYLLRFGLTNGNREFTELATLDNNYLQIIAQDARFASTKVSTGDFHRYDLLRQRGDKIEPTFRQANVLRLYVPILEGQQRVRSGDVELVGRGTPNLELSGQFLLPDGRILELPTRVWRGGAFQDE